MSAAVAFAAASLRRLESGPGPRVALLDAGPAGLDPSGLRAEARQHSARQEARYHVRSYRYPYALVAWHDEPVGVDIERIEPCDAAFADLICTPVEREAVNLEPDRDAYLSSLWCGKEALSKALGDALQYAPHRLASPLHWPEHRAGPWHARALDTVPGHVAWLCWSSAAADPQRRAQGLVAPLTMLSSARS